MPSDAVVVAANSLGSVVGVGRVVCVGLGAVVVVVARAWCGRVVAVVEVCDPWFDF